MKNELRDVTLQAKVDINLGNTILLRNWSKDYFTSALPWQQRGTAPALPITGTVHAVFNHANYLPSAAPSPTAVQFRGDMVTKMMYVQNATGVTNAQQFMDDNSIDLSSASTFDVADLRLAFQVQRWMERNARAGVRYTEFLRSHFGVSPRDERLQRPEYIGGSKAPIIFSEVLQTSQSGTTPQGNMAGHGITASSKFCGSYHATEFGLIMGIMSIMPVPAYNCQGIDRQWIKPTRYDYYFPEFANLSEQAVYNKEICTTLDDARNEQIFGYQGRYDEMRVKRNMTVSGMRNTFAYWHLARTFDVGAPPSLNSAFIQCVPRKDIFAVPSQPGLIVSFGIDFLTRQRMHINKTKCQNTAKEIRPFGN